MNRHHRRAAAAKAWSKSGYKHRLLAAHESGDLRLQRGAVNHVHAMHDDGCSIFGAGSATAARISSAGLKPRSTSSTRMERFGASR